MALHARPHLETHSRGAGHSAIAGVAYRLGLRLYDRRTGVWHDYRRRKIGEEIVRALTVAPEGAPVWATDPGELWNRVEAAEKRKDAQVARDYRIPVPIGLTDQQAGDLAEEMARFICRELHTAVSLGLHRDADVDALGNVKPPDRQGFHAHIYFPTRRLEEIQGEDGASNWGLGAKLVLLSNKNTSGAFVERLNEKWAELANRYTAANNLPADYTHLSYARQDLPITPQPTLGAAVTAMERRGFFTRRGDALRGDIMLPAKVYEAAHAVVLDEQHRRAMEDVARERETVREANPEPETVGPGEIIPPATLAPVVLMPLLDGEPGSLVARFQAAAPIPETPEAHQVLARVLRLVQVIQRVLGALAELADRFRIHGEGRERRMAAKLDTDFQLDQARAMRAATRQRLTDWEDVHPLLMFLAKKAGNDEGKPAAWRTLRNAVEVQECRVQEIKGTRRHHQVHLDAFDQEAQVLKQEEVENKSRLDQALNRVQALSQVLADKLMSATNEEERVWIEAVRPAPAPAPVVPLEEVPPQPRLRPAPRLVG
ncbi:MobA/MobL family protein [Dyella sp. EPa41]|uniref:MobA/MobL family protein n=1 Tax=Dyella sp. EPa41 TaxID=1561194 RepID=UPI001914FA84|nr:MobA/MobL family protein [Dyella sp. EPa41]